jgi:hypothetical protein
MVLYVTDMPLAVVLGELREVMKGPTEKEPESPYVAKLNSQIVKELGDDIRILKEALAAAEAECAEWREDCVRLVPAANANDATRERLGLGKIGEAKSP